MSRAYITVACIAASLAIVVALGLMFPFWERDARVELGGGIAAGTLVGAGLFAAQLAAQRRQAEERLVKALAALDERYPELGRQARSRNWAVGRVEAAAYHGIVPDDARAEYSDTDLQGRDLRELDNPEKADR